MKVSLVALLAALSSSALAIPVSPFDTLPKFTTAAQLVEFIKEHHASAGHYTPSIESGHGSTHGSASGDKGLLGDIGGSLNSLLTVTGPNVESLLIELSPDVADLLSGLGLPGLGVPVGEIIKSAATLGELLEDLGPVVEGLLTVVSKDVGCLLIKLSPSVTELLSNLGLPAVGDPVGSVVATLGGALKGSGAHSLKDLTARGSITVPGVTDDFRGESWDSAQHTAKHTSMIVNGATLKASKDLILEDHRYIKTSDGRLLKDLGQSVGGLLEVTGPDAKRLLIKLSPNVVDLLNGLGLDFISEPVGDIIKSAASVGDLLKDLSGPVEGLFCVLSEDVGALLVKLSPALVDLLSGLGLDILEPVGEVVMTLGKSV